MTIGLPPIRPAAGHLVIGLASRRPLRFATVKKERVNRFFIHMGAGDLGQRATDLTDRAAHGKVGRIAQGIAGFKITI